MSKKFDAESYVNQWDKILIPAISLFIVGSMIAVYALQVVTSTECTPNQYVYCGEEQGHAGGGQDHH